MVADHLSRANIYFNLSEQIKRGLIFLQSVHHDIQLGEHFIADGVKAIVSEYMTKTVFEPGYESHKHVIDIQYPVIGLERVRWSPVDKMKIKTPYDPQKDVMYFEQPTQYCQVDIGKGIFAIMFPDDGHYPQLLVEHAELIKKVTIKISI